MVLQLQLAFFQAAQLQFFMTYIVNQGFDDRVEIPVFDLEFDDASLDIVGRIHAHIVAQPAWHRQY